MLSVRESHADGLLFRTDNFPLDVLLVVGSSAGGAKAIQVVLDVVVTELADLKTAKSAGLQRRRHYHKT